jgi:hypothetical protein
LDCHVNGRKGTESVREQDAEENTDRAEWLQERINDSPKAYKSG